MGGEAARSDAGNVLPESRETRGPDARYVDAVAQFYGRTLLQRVAAVEDQDDAVGVATEVLKGFHRAVANLERDRIEVLSRAYEVVPVDGPVVDGLIAPIDHDARIVPRFQLNDAGQPNGDVLEINQRLGVEKDPWSAAVWWYLPNEHLGNRVPVDVLQESGAVALRDSLDHPVYSF